MSNLFEKNIKKAAEGYSLSDAEKARMERVLKQYIRFKPIRTEYVHVTAWTWISYLHRPLAAALVMVLVTTSSAAYAAESSLPGDVLYAVKTNVNEPVRVALATNAEAKAEVQMELAERRIEEATVLSAEGRLDDSTRDELAAAFESYAAEVSKRIEEVEESDSNDSSELAARFETRLVAHESVLAEIEMEAEAGTEDRSNSNRLSDAIRQTSEVLAVARFNRESISAEISSSGEVIADAGLMATKVSEDAALLATAEPTALMAVVTEPAQENARVEKITAVSAPDDRTISRMKSAAERSLKNAERSLRKAKSLSAEAKAKAEADVALANELFEGGGNHRDSGDDAAAYAAFKDSLRVSEQAIVYIKAAPSLEKARTRNSRNRSSSDAAKDVEIKVNVSLPEATSNATINSTTSLEVNSDGIENGEPDNHGREKNDDREPNEDGRDGDDDSGGGGGIDSGSGVNIFQKLHISL